jgi:hypothetical protein
MTKYLYMVIHLQEMRKDSVKSIGIFDSLSKAKSAVREISDRPGFQKYKRGFVIEQCVLNQIYWSEGFITWDEAVPPS